MSDEKNQAGELVPPPPATRAPRLDFVDGLRGLAILAVLLCHTWYFAGKHEIALGPLSLSGPLEFGYLGVHLFLVLSGFCLSWPLVRSGAVSLDGQSAGHFPPLRIGDFYRRRIERILPAYYGSIVLVAALSLLLPAIATPTIGSVVAHALMLHNFFPQYVFDIVGSYWSLGLEWQFYLFFPVMVAAARRWGVIRIALLLLAITVVYRVAIWNLMPLRVDPNSPQELIQVGTGIGWTSLLPGRLFDFAVGMVAAVWLGQLGEKTSGRQLAAPIVAVAGLGAGILLTLLWGRFAPLTDIAFSVGFGGLLIAGASAGAHSPRWCLRRLLEWRPLVGLGVISYSVYLTHHPLVLQICAWLAPLRLTGWTAFFVFQVLLIPLLILIGYGFYRLVELPALQAAQHRRRQRRQKSADFARGAETLDSAETAPAG